MEQLVRDYTWMGWTESEPSWISLLEAVVAAVLSLFSFWSLIMLVRPGDLRLPRTFSSSISFLSSSSFKEVCQESTKVKLKTIFKEKRKKKQKNDF